MSRVGDLAQVVERLSLDPIHSAVWVRPPPAANIKLQRIGLAICSVRSARTLGVISLPAYSKPMLPRVYFLCCMHVVYVYVVLRVPYCVR